jgi:hypothetical protein
MNADQELPEVPKLPNIHGKPGQVAEIGNLTFDTWKGGEEIGKSGDRDIGRAGRDFWP